MGDLRKPSVKLSSLSSDYFGCCHHWNICEKGKSCPFVQQFDDPEFAQRCSIYKQYIKPLTKDITERDSVSVLFPQTSTIKSLICAWQSVVKQLQSKSIELYVSDIQFTNQMLRLSLSNGKNESNTEKINQMENEGSCTIQHYFPQHSSIPDCITQIHSLLHKLSRQLFKVNGWEEVSMKWEKPYFFYEVIHQVKSVPIHVNDAADFSFVDDGSDHLLLIDGSSLLTRSYFATIKTVHLKTSTGLYTNAVLPMMRMLFHLLAEFKPTHFAIGWDQGRNTWRRKAYKEYKANRRETDPALKEQFQTAQDLFREIGIYQYGHENFEADDVIGTLSKRWVDEKKARVSIITGDRDLLQLLDEEVTVYFPDKGVTKKDRFTLREMENKHGFTTPRQFIEVKGLLGDSSDNLPGVKGIGEKKAYPLIQRYHTLENIYDHLDEISQDPELKRCVIPLELCKENAFLSRDLAIIRTDMPDLLQVPWDQVLKRVDKQGMLNAFKQLEFDQLIKEIKSGKYRAS